MMFYMTSKAFQNSFLPNEPDKDILKAQYVIVSSRIRVRDKEHNPNILNAYNTLYPSAFVMSALTKEDLQERYKEEMKERNLALLASLVRITITKNLHIIFLCTNNERKLHFLEALADTIYEEFYYPVYDYEMYSLGISKMIPFDKGKVLKCCKKYLSNAKDEYYRKFDDNEKRKNAMMEDYKKMKTKELKELLKQKDLYRKGMDKEDMLEMVEVFLT